jgi:hypothetical protein
VNRRPRVPRQLANPIALAIMNAAVMDTAEVERRRTIELSAIESFRTGRATRDDWMAIADIANVCETLAHDGIGPEALPASLAAQEALGAAHARHAAGGSLGVTGPQLQAFRELYEYHDLQRQSISRGRYDQAVKKTADRIRGSAAEKVRI